MAYHCEILLKVVKDVEYLPQKKSFDCGPNELFRIGCSCFMFSIFSLH